MSRLDPGSGERRDALANPPTGAAAPAGGGSIYHRVEVAAGNASTEGNIVFAIVAGSVAALACAALWAMITVATRFQIGWMAVGVGLAVGFAVRIFGKGDSQIFQIVGAGLALVGCLVGNLLSAISFVAENEQLAFFEALGIVLGNPGIAISLMRDTFQVMDVLFYGIAVYEGWRFSANPA